MLRIYTAYPIYQINDMEWQQFGNSAWFCKEESKVEEFEIIIQNASFEQAYSYFQQNPFSGIYACKTVMNRPYLQIVRQWHDTPTNLYRKDCASISISMCNIENENVTLEWIIKHLPAEKTIQYLKEHGLSI